MRTPDLSKAHWMRDPALRRLLDVLSAEGEGRVVGGAVRNALMKLPVHEVDIATDLVPEQVARMCRAAGLGVHPTGIDHGTLTIVVQGKPFEVTTLRKDVQTDGRRAVVAFTRDWQTDAMRRDFTINALYVDRAGKIYDFTNGYADVRKRKVRFIGAPQARIREDYLRVLRFFRFHAQFGKGRPDAKGLAACRKLKTGLAQLSTERIRQEMLKLLVAPGAIAALKTMAQAGILRKVLDHTEDWRNLGRLPADAVLRLTLLSARPSELKDQFKLSNKDATRIKALLDAPVLTPDLKTKERYRILYETGEACWRDAVQVAWARSSAPLSDRRWHLLLNVPKRWTRPVFPVTGNMLRERGVAPGPRMGQVLRQLEDWWIASDFKPGQSDLLDYLGTLS